MAAALCIRLVPRLTSVICSCLPSTDATVIPLGEEKHAVRAEATTACASGTSVRIRVWFIYLSLQGQCVVPGDTH
jgi:hypothetical protein